MSADLLPRLLALQPALAASETLREQVAAEYLAHHTSQRVTDQGVTFDREDGRGLYMPWRHVRWLLAEFDR